MNRGVCTRQNFRRVWRTPFAASDLDIGRDIILIPVIVAGIDEVQKSSFGLRLRPYFDCRQRQAAVPPDQGSASPYVLRE